MTPTAKFKHLLIVLLGLLIGPALAADSTTWPRIPFVGQVRADVTEIVIQTGTVHYPRQIPLSEVRQAGDEVRDRMLWRDGQPLGNLVGPNDDIFFGYDQIESVPLAVDPLLQAASVILQSDDDPEFHCGRPAVAVWRKTKPYEVARIGGWDFDAPLQHHLFLVWPEALTDGHEYQITLPGDKLPPITFTPSSRDNLSEAIHVNQIGFHPAAPSKKAFLSCWMGSGGGLDYPKGLSFVLVDAATEKVAHNGELKLHRSADQNDDRALRNYAETDVWEADFSDFTTPGTYRLSIDGIGSSLPFPIGGDVWLNAFAVSAKGFYPHRRSVAITAPYSEFQRPRSFHPDEQEIFLTEATLLETRNGLGKTAPNNFVEIRAKATEIPAGDWAWGGLMDAGDWDSRIQHLNVTRHLLELVELSPDILARLDLNLPESNNDLPDLIDEALFNLDHYRRMQTPGGGIRGGIESENHPRYGEASWQESYRVYVYAPDPWSSYLYTATAAQAARVLQPFDPALSKIYLDSALRAMAWAEAEYLSHDDWPSLVGDSRNHAAASLLRLTGETRWNEIFLETTAFDDPSAKLFVWGERDQIEAVWDYVQCDSHIVNQEVQENCRTALLQDAERYVHGSARSAFRLARRLGAAVGWGSFVIPEGGALIRAHQLTGDPRYLKTLIDLTLAGSGANPVNKSYTIGLGVRNPRRVLHADSFATGQAPPEGITVLGPLETRRWGDFYSSKLVKPFLYPELEQWPSIEAHWEMTWFPAMNEYVVQGPMIKTAYTWGYLAAILGRDDS